MDGYRGRALTLMQVCDILGIGRTTGYRLIREGAIPSFRVGRGIRVWGDDLAGLTVRRG